MCTNMIISIYIYTYMYVYICTLNIIASVERLGSQLPRAQARRACQDKLNERKHFAKVSSTLILHHILSSELTVGNL